MAHLLSPSSALAKGEGSAQVQLLSHALNLLSPFRQYLFQGPQSLVSSAVSCCLEKEHSLSWSTLFSSTDAP